jgi:hypothetical protein
MLNETIHIPESSNGDLAHAMTKAGLSAIPLLGGPAVELFQYVVRTPLEKRRDAWMAKVGDKLLELETQGIKLEDLQTNEQFVSVVMNATSIALRTHQAEKLDALRNAVMNVAKGQSPEETLQHMFLGFIDSFSELHLRILKAFQAPLPPPALMSEGAIGTLSDVLEFNVPELLNRQDVYIHLWRDLCSCRLIEDTMGEGMVSLEGMVSDIHIARKRTSDFGDKFLAFITQQ